MPRPRSRSHARWWTARSSSPRTAIASGLRVARSAYLEHFEFVEIPLRLRNPNLVLDLEFKFADLRDRIRAGDPV